MREKRIQVELREIDEETIGGEVRKIGRVKGGGGHIMNKIIRRN